MLKILNISNNLLCKFFINKHVAFVGPSKSLIGKKYGKIIDSNDIVVRFNYMYPLSGEFSEDLGEKTQILYHCFCKRSESESIAINKLINSKDKELKCLISVQTLWNGRNEHGTQVGPDASKLRDEIISSQKFPYHIIEDYFVQKFKKDYSVEVPTIGVVAIKHILLYNPKKISIFGFTFHKDEYYKGYNDNHKNYWNQMEPEKIGPHKIKEQIDAYLLMKKEYPDKIDLLYER